MKHLTWKQVRDYLNTCSEEQLSYSACVQTLDEPSTYIVEMSTNDQDLVWNDEMDEGSVPVDEYNESDYGFPLDSKENTIYPKGTLLWAFDKSFTIETP